MLRILIKDMEALMELKESYGVKSHKSIIPTLRRVIPKLIYEDDNLEFILPLAFLSKAYNKNPQAFCQHLRHNLGLKAAISKNAKLGIIVLRVGYEVPTFKFATHLINALRDPNTFSVDVPVSKIPPAYVKQIHHFLNRLTKRLKVKISYLNLGEDYRFIKAKPKTKKHETVPVQANQY